MGEHWKAAVALVLALSAAAIGGRVQAHPFGCRAAGVQQQHLLRLQQREGRLHHPRQTGARAHQPHGAARPAPGGVRHPLRLLGQRRPEFGRPGLQRPGRLQADAALEPRGQRRRCAWTTSRTGTSTPRASPTATTGGCSRATAATWAICSPRRRAAPSPTATPGRTGGTAATTRISRIMTATP